MGREWEADISVGPSLAAELIEEQFPTLAPVKIVSFGAGWDNTAFLVNERYVFRFPRRKFAVQFMENEIRVLPRITATLPLAVPVLEFVGRPSVEFPYPFAGHELIQGETVDRAKFGDQDREQAAIVLGRFLKELHATHVSLADAPGDTLRRLDIPHRILMAHERLDYATAHGLIEDFAAFNAALDLAPSSYEARADTLVHGDLYSRHLVRGTDHCLAGVIDWGDVHIGDAASDLMIIYTFLPPAARRVFLDIYGAVDPLTLRVARFRAAYHTTCLLCFAHETQDLELWRESRISAINLCQD